MEDLCLGMIGFMLAGGAFWLGRYTAFGKKAAPEAAKEAELSAEEKRRKEQLLKDIHAVFHYQGRKGGDKE